MDGVFVLKMLTIHSGILVCTEVVDVMWDAFLAEIGKYPISEDELKKAELPGSDLLETPRPPPRRKISVLVPLVTAKNSLRSSSLLMTPHLNHEQHPSLKRPSTAQK
uniref:Uncharacterized protein n=1 Tax=Acrobeloides nanus TaxID=290746 RepID=A0A914C3G6_9BILA